MLRRSSTKKEKPAKAPKVKATKEKKVKEKRPKAAKATAKVKPTGAKAKYRTDVYTLMLLFAFLAVLTACVFLYLDLSRYGSNRKPSGAAVIEQIDMTRGIYS